MPFRDPIRFLVLPTGISIPPPTGSSAIFLDPGPPPVIKLYTGDAGELTPAEIRAATSLGIPQLVLTGPDTSASLYGPASITEGISAGGANNEAFIELIAEDITLRNNSEALTYFKAHSANGGDIAPPPLSYVDIARFKTSSTNMQAKFDVNGNDVNALVNTAYATPTGQLCGVSFVGPPSGRGLITWHMRADFNFSGAAALNRSVRACAVLRNGSTIGAGTDPSLAEGQTTPNDDYGSGHAITHPTGTGAIGGPAQHGSFHVEGLTPGNSYNAFLQAKCNSATTFNYDVLYQKIGWIPLY
jgi:hypothetical protein